MCWLGTFIYQVNPDYEYQSQKFPAQAGFYGENQKIYTNFSDQCSKFLLFFFLESSKIKTISFQFGNPALLGI